MESTFLPQIVDSLLEEVKFVQLILSFLVFHMFPFLEEDTKALRTHQPKSLSL